MFAYTIVAHSEVNRTLKKGLISNYEHRVLLALNAHLDIQNDADEELFNIIHSGIQPAIGKDGKPVFAFHGAYRLKLEIRQDQASPITIWNLTGASFYAELVKNPSLVKELFGERWLIASGSIEPSQIKGVCKWSELTGSWEQIRTFRRIDLHDEEWAQINKQIYHGDILSDPKIIPFPASRMER